MIRLLRTLLLLGFWILFIPFAALIGFPATFITGKIDFLYRLAMWGANAGIRLSGVKIEIIGLDRLDPARKYIFMSNHVSNLDPPIEVPLIPGRTSVLVKKELFRVPCSARPCTWETWCRWTAPIVNPPSTVCAKQPTFCATGRCI